MNSKRIAKGLLLVAIVFCFSCVSAFNPLYTESTVYFDPGLVGEYNGGAGAASCTLQQGPDRTSYTMIYRNDKGLVEKKFVVHFVKLGDDYFVDVEQPIIGIRPKINVVHSIDRVTFQNHNITFWGFEEEKEKGGFDKDGRELIVENHINKFYDRPDVEAGELLYQDEKSKEEKKDRAMTFTTENLQKFFQAHLKEMTKKEVELKRTGDAH